jgi:hypothetical protein
MADAAHHCESSMTRSENPGGAYTCWNSMATLVNKALIIKQGHPSKWVFRVSSFSLKSTMNNVLVPL